MDKHIDNMMSELPAVNAKIKKLVDERSRGRVSNFAKDIGLSSHQTIARLFNIDSRNGKYPAPSLSIIKSILSTYPDLDYNWFGLNELDGNNSAPIITASPNDYMRVQYIPIIEQADYINNITNTIEYYNKEKSQTMLVQKEIEEGNYIVVEISGDSMNDSTVRGICDGDRLLLKEISAEDWRGKLQFRQNIFVIISDEGVVCKQILENNTEKLEITCHSWNKSYPDYTISLNEVKKLFYVKKIVERRIKF